MPVPREEFSVHTRRVVGAECEDIRTLGHQAQLLDPPIQESQDENWNQFHEIQRHAANAHDLFTQHKGRGLSLFLERNSGVRAADSPEGPPVRGADAFMSRRVRADTFNRKGVNSMSQALPFASHHRDKAIENRAGIRKLDLLVSETKEKRWSRLAAGQQVKPEGNVGMHHEGNINDRINESGQPRPST